MSIRWVCWLSAVWLAVAGCDDLREFQTGKGSVFRGEVVGSDSDPDASSFIRNGFPSHTRMELTFDPYAASVGPEASGGDHGEPGRIHTFTCPAEQPHCDSAQGVPGPFDHAPLEIIANLPHDLLSQYTFPGGTRLRNYLFIVRFTSELDDGTSAARNASVFVSLMDSGQIEVRAIAPSLLAADGKRERMPALFGVFVLDRLAP